MIRSWLVAVAFSTTFGGAALAQAPEAAPAAAPSAEAPAQPAPAAPAGTASPAATDANGEVCKRIKVTGSRLGVRRVCKSSAQWEAEAEQARKTANDRQRRSGGGTTGG